MPSRNGGGLGTNQESVRRHNVATVLGHVHRSNGISRAGLTRLMGLNRSTIADLVRELEELAAVRQSVPSSNGKSKSGRPSISVDPASESIYVLAAEIGVEAMQIARIGLGGKPLDRVSGATPSSRDPHEVAKRLGVLLDEMLDAAGDRGRLVGIGLAVPGVVNDAEGLVEFAPNLGWNKVRFGELLAANLSVDVPIRLGNDGELGALAEHIRGAGRDKSDLIYLSCDVGVGGGFILGGQPNRGASGYAGEVGHMRFDSRGDTCRCGNIGCWETVVGSHALADAVGSLGPEPAQLRSALGELSASDAGAIPALATYASDLGTGLGVLVNMFNPEAIILGGVMRDAYPLIQEPVLEAMRTWALRAPVERVEVLLPGLADNSTLVGAAEIAFSDLLEDPVAVLGDEVVVGAESANAV